MFYWPYWNITLRLWAKEFGMLCRQQFSIWAIWLIVPDNKAPFGRNYFDLCSPIGPPASLQWAAALANIQCVGVPKGWVVISEVETGRSHGTTGAKSMHWFVFETKKDPSQKKVFLLWLDCGAYNISTISSLPGQNSRLVCDFQGIADN